jgi:hypothetical protein
MKNNYTESDKDKDVLDKLTPRYEDEWGNGGIAPPFLISAVVGSDWSASRPEGQKPGETDPEYPLDRGLSGFQSGSGRSGEEKNDLTPPGIEPRLSSP